MSERPGKHFASRGVCMSEVTDRRSRMQVRKAFYEQLALYDHVTVEHGALAAVTQHATQAVHEDEHRFGRPDHVHADQEYTDAELRVAA